MTSTTNELLVRALEDEDVAACCALAGQWPHTSFHYLPEIDRSALGAWAWSVAEPLVRSAGSTALVVTRGDAVCAVGFVAVRDWESEALGIRTALMGPIFVDCALDDKRDVASVLVSALLSRGRELGIRHVTVRVDTADLWLIQVMESCGLQTVDMILHTVCRLADPVEPRWDPEMRTRRFVPSDLPRLRELASGVYRYDRFHADPAIDTSRANARYLAWLETSVNDPHEGVVVATLGDEVMSFLTYRSIPGSLEVLRVGIGKLWLTAVDPRTRGKGAFAAMAAFAHDEFREQGLSYVEGGTQLHHRSMLRGLSRAGFTLANSVVALRALL